MTRRSGDATTGRVPDGCEPGNSTARRVSARKRANVAEMNVNVGIDMYPFFLEHR